MEAIFISIKPEYAEKILRGEKTVELRRTLPRHYVSTAYIYATAPVKRIVGKFHVRGFGSAMVDDLWEQVKDRACVSKEYFDAYYAKHDPRRRCPYIEIGEVTRFSEPIDPKKVNPAFHVPQSWCYIEAKEGGNA